MGHFGISETVFGQPTLKAAYDYLRVYADWDGEWSRHDSGVVEDRIYTTPILSDDHTALTKACEDVFNRTVPYEPALGFPVIKVEPARYEYVRKENLTVEFTAAELSQHHSEPLSPLGQKKVAKILGVNVDEIQSISTRYFIIKKGSDHIPDWDKGFATQAAARAQVSGVKNLEAHMPSFVSKDLEISIIRRQDGGALVYSKSHVTKATLNLSVQIHRKVSERHVTNEQGWMIVGWYHN